MKIERNNSLGQGRVGEAAPAAKSAATPAGPSPMDPERGASLAAFSGAVQSRRTYAYTPVVVRQPQPNTVQASAAVKLSDVQEALADERVPNLNVTVNGNRIQVDGLNLTYAEGKEGQATFTASAINLQQNTVNAAVKKLAGLANVAKVLRHIAANPQMMVEPKIIGNADGSIDIKFVAKVRVNPKLEKQADFVRSQHSDGQKMPERVKAAVAARRRRGTVQT